MKTSQFKDYSELPLFLNAEIIAKVLGTLPASSYELMHESGFPVLKIGSSDSGPQRKIYLLGGRKYCQGYNIMRRHRPLIGWPMWDSKRRRFSMPNEIWKYKLRPIKFTIFSYLCYHQGHDLPEQITLQIIANGVHSMVSTVKKYIASLISKGPNHQQMVTCCELTVQQL